MEALIGGVYGVLGGLAIERGWRIGLVTPVLVGLAAAAVVVSILLRVVYQEFSWYRLLMAAGWAAGLIFFPPPDVSRNVAVRTGDASATGTAPDP